MKISWRRVVLTILFLAAIAITRAAAAAAAPHTVDYLIGMLEAGVDQSTIITRIHEKNLTFRLEEGDLDRLKAAGASDALVTAVAGEEKGGGSSEAWSRPRRMEEEQSGGAQEEAAPPDEGEGTGETGGAPEAQEENVPHGGYPYYRSGEDDSYHPYYNPYAVYYGPPWYDYDYYPFSFYYSYYYPSFYYPYRFYSPYYFYYYGGSFGRGPMGGRVVPRGTPRGSWGGGIGHPSSPRGSRPGPRPKPRGH